MLTRYDCGQAYSRHGPVNGGRSQTAIEPGSSTQHAPDPQSYDRVHVGAQVLGPPSAVGRQPTPSQQSSDERQTVALPGGGVPSGRGATEQLEGQSPKGAQYPAAQQAVKPHAATVSAVVPASAQTRVQSARVTPFCANALQVPSQQAPVLQSPPSGMHAAASLASSAPPSLVGSGSTLAGVESRPPSASPASGAGSKALWRPVVLVVVPVVPELDETPPPPSGLADPVDDDVISLGVTPVGGRSATVAAVPPHAARSSATTAPAIDRAPVGGGSGGSAALSFAAAVRGRKVRKESMEPPVFTSRQRGNGAHMRRGEQAGGIR